MKDFTHGVNSLTALKCSLMTELPHNVVRSYRFVACSGMDCIWLGGLACSVHSMGKAFGFLLMKTSAPALDCMSTHLFDFSSLEGSSDSCFSCFQLLLASSLAKSLSVSSFS